ncbi:MAG: alpha/beta hydrolase [Actinomycetota bacterium]
MRAHRFHETGTGRLLVALLASAFVVGACSRPKEAPEPPAPSKGASLLDGEAMDACIIEGTTAFCGSLRVPEDRGTPSGRQIDLNVAVIPAARPEGEDDPVFFLAGGPGGAATQSWARAATIFPGVHETRNIVLVDQRGTGRSEPLIGPALPNVAGLSRSEQGAAAKAWIREALTQTEADPRFYTSVEAADDLDDVRSALGYETINLYGSSYGATLAQYYLRLHGEHARAVVLDGGTLLDVPVLELIAARSQAALETVFTACDRNEPCRTAFPHLESEFLAVIDELAAQPIRTDVKDPITGEQVVVSADTFAELIHQLLVESRSGEVPAVVHLAASGDAEAIAERIVGSDGTASLFRQLMLWSIFCSEPWAAYDLRDVARFGRHSYLGASQLAFAENVRMICRMMPRRSPRSWEDEPVRSTVPVLLLNGTADPQDPPDNVANAPLELQKSLSVPVRGYGHTVGHIGCLPVVVAAFFTAGTTVDLDTRCAQVLPEPSFLIP